jgi:Phage integrase family
VQGCEVAELHDVRVHDLRHTFGLHWIQAGLPLPRLQKILGHATPAMTLRYSRHAPEAFFTGDAAAMDASLSDASLSDATDEAEAVRKAVVQRAKTA